MINRIGIELGLNMNNVKLVRANGQIRFLSEYFLSPNEALTHGAEICGSYLEDHEMAKQIANHKKTARELFTFEFISKAIEFVFPSAFEEILLDLVKMIAFDALVGNNDRHFYNWGVIDTIKRSKKRPKFAPIYDSARGLLWNFSEDNIVKHLESYNSGGNKIEKYISNATPRISIEGDSDCNHFQLVSFVKSHKGDYGEIIDELASESNEKKIYKMLDRDLFQFISKERKELIGTILKSRFEQVRNC
ncbi:MAG: HipA domain-containing protein [Cytophagales bacterium]|nr:HipA domain-containing protein [Cytophagales bacterium]